MGGSESDEDHKDFVGLLANAVAFILVAALIIGVLVFGVYFANFNNGLSDSQADWGAFGDFIGGVLNPLFGFLTLFALILTLILQNRQLAVTKDDLLLSREELKKTSDALGESRDIAAAQAAHIENQAMKEDIYRIITRIDDDIESLAKRKIQLVWMNNGQKSVCNLTLFNIFGLEKTVPVYEGIDFDQRSWKSTHTALEPLIRLLVEFKDYLGAYESLAGDSLTGHFKNRLSEVCWDLYQKEHLDVSVYDFFSSSMKEETSEMKEKQSPSLS